MMRAATERCRPPAPPTTTRSPISACLESAQRKGRQIEAGQRLHQAEARLLVVAQHVPGTARPSLWLIHTVSASVMR